MANYIINKAGVFTNVGDFDKILRANVNFTATYIGLNTDAVLVETNYIFDSDQAGDETELDVEIAAYTDPTHYHDSAHHRLAEYADHCRFMLNETTAHLGIVYKSLVDDNIANTPASSPTKWAVITGVSTFNGPSVALGQDARSVTPGINGVGIGLEAGKTSQGDNSVAIGRKAGELNQGDNSIAIGASTTGTGINEIVIGYNVTGKGLNTASYGNASTLTQWFYGSLLPALASKNLGSLANSWLKLFLGGKELSISGADLIFDAKTVNTIKNKYDATTAPGVDNDTTEGYAVGSQWIDVTNDNAYTCVDITDAAAVWVHTNDSGGGTKVTLTSNKTDVDITSGVDLLASSVDLEFVFENNTGSGANIEMFFDDGTGMDTLATNYYDQNVEFNGSGHVPGRPNNSVVSNLIANGEGQVIIHINQIGNVVKWIAHSTYSIGSGLRHYSRAGSYASGTGTIVGIRLHSTVASALKTGSHYTINNLV